MICTQSELHKVKLFMILITFSLMAFIYDANQLSIKSQCKCPALSDIEKV